jgi:Leucine-rich repeat (LRR) protein
MTSTILIKHFYHRSTSEKNIWSKHASRIYNSNYLLDNVRLEIDHNVSASCLQQFVTFVKHMGLKTKRVNVVCHPKMATDCNRLISDLLNYWQASVTHLKLRASDNSLLQILDFHRQSVMEASLIFSGLVVSSNIQCFSKLEIFKLIVDPSLTSEAYSKLFQSLFKQENQYYAKNLLKALVSLEMRSMTTSNDMNLALGSLARGTPTVGPHLTHLHLASKKYIEIPFLKTCTVLQSIALYGKGTDFSVFGGFKLLKRISIEFNRLTQQDVTLVITASATTLEYLSLESCGLKEFPILCKLPNLTHLNLSNNSLVHIPDGNYFENIVNLNKLYLKYNKISHVDFPSGVLPHLQILDLRANNIETVFKNSNCELFELEKLFITSMCEIEYVGDSIARAKNLKVVRVSLKRSITEPSDNLQSLMGYLSQLPQLEELDLRNNTLHSIDQNISFPSLTKLNLSSNFLSDGVAIEKVLQRSPNLHSVQLFKNPLLEKYFATRFTSFDDIQKLIVESVFQMNTPDEVVQYLYNSRVVNSKSVRFLSVINYADISEVHLWTRDKFVGSRLSYVYLKVNRSTGKIVPGTTCKYVDCATYNGITQTITMNDKFVGLFVLNGHLLAYLNDTLWTR